MPKMMQKIIAHYVAYEINDELRYAVTCQFDKTPGATLAAVNKLKEANGYIPVAAIEYDERISLEANLENAYKLMQNGVVTDSWTLSPPDGLTPLVDPIDHEGSAMGHRSASMGDIFEYGGNHYLVATFGFEKV